MEVIVLNQKTKEQRKIEITKLNTRYVKVGDNINTEEIIIKIIRKKEVRT